MKLKKILRIVGTFIYWFILGYLISECVFGDNTVIVNVALIFYGINILVHITKLILEIVLDNKRFKKYKLLFYYLTQSHKARYSCLLQGDTKGAIEYEDLMKKCSDAILKVGPSMSKYKTLTKKDRKEIQKIFDETKVLITKIQPSV